MLPLFKVTNCDLKEFKISRFDRFRYRSHYFDSCPIDQAQSVNSLKFSKTVGNQRQPLAACMAGDMQIIDTNRSTLTFQISSNFPVMGDRFTPIRQHFQPGNEVFNLL